MLESCGFRARIGLKVLEQKSLITISSYDVLGMRDHIEEMGKNIVRRLHPDEPNKHSRLWINEEICDILVNDLGTEATRCILRYHMHDPEILLRGLQNVKKLRYLGIDCMDRSKLDEDKIFMPNSLRFVNWYIYPSCFLLKKFQADNLVGLRMEAGNIKQLWEGKERKVLSKLKFLNLNHSRFLETLDLQLTPNLETLYLEYCEGLQELHMPVGGCMKLKSMKFNYSRLTKLNLIGLSLETLSLRHCYYLEELNIPFPCPNLKSMDLYGARSLRTLDLGMTTNLERLNAYWCSSNLVGIHAPVGCLKKLVYVDFGLCRTFLNIKFDKQIESHKAAVSLSELNLTACSVYECPLHPLNYSSKFNFRCIYNENPTLSLGNLGRFISAGFCPCTNLESFLNNICGLRCLRKLTLNGNIPEAPKHFDRLECLEELILSYTDFTHLPDNICMLKHLKSLKLDKCSRFEKLPEDFGQFDRLECLEELIGFLGRLECLEKLSLSSGDISDSICKLKHLKTLELGRLECLEVLDLTSTPVSHLPDSISRLKGLRIFGYY